MRALLRKDYYVMRKQFWLFAVIITLFQLMPGGIFLSVLYAALLPASAFAYDDRSRWWELSAMLPYSELDIVLSRYCFGWLGILAFTVLTMAARALIALILPFPLSADAGNAAEFMTMFSLSASFLAVSLPIYFRFETEKSRIVRTILLMVICGFMSGLYALSGMGKTPLDLIFSYTPPVILITVVLTAVSIPLSVLAYRARRG